MRAEVGAERIERADLTLVPSAEHEVGAEGLDGDDVTRADLGRPPHLKPARRVTGIRPARTLR
jgi:hypothetical protein